MAKRGKEQSEEQASDSPNKLARRQLDEYDAQVSDAYGLAQKAKTGHVWLLDNITRALLVVVKGRKPS